LKFLKDIFVRFINRFLFILNDKRAELKFEDEMVSEILPVNFVPNKEQIETLARRMMPEIKKFFADEKIQQEFAEWKERQRADT
jgi:hypothetical protein